MDLLSNNSMFLLEKSMGFLWTKQAAILDNITNAETPGYKAKVVTFEETLRDKLEDAVQSSTPIRSARRILEESAPAVFEAQESTRLDNNGVNVTDQSAELIRNAYQLQYVMSAISSDLAALRAVARGQ